MHVHINFLCFTCIHFCVYFENVFVLIFLSQCFTFKTDQANEMRYVERMNQVFVRLMSVPNPSFVHLVGMISVCWIAFTWTHSILCAIVLRNIFMDIFSAEEEKDTVLKKKRWFSVLSLLFVVSHKNFSQISNIYRQHTIFLCY